MTICDTIPTTKIEGEFLEYKKDYMSRALPPAAMDKIQDVLFKLQSYDRRCQGSKCESFVSYGVDWYCANKLLEENWKSNVKYAGI